MTFAAWTFHVCPRLDWEPVAPGPRGQDKHAGGKAGGKAGGQPGGNAVILRAGNLLVIL